MGTEGNDMSDGDAADLTELEPTRRTGSLKTRSFVLGGVLIVVAGAALFTWKQVKPVVESRKYASITYEVPKAPKLTPAEGETVYRIDPTKSSLSYKVQEQFAGKSTSSATGTTNGIAGDIALDPSDLGAARVGKVVVNLEQLHSDNNLRDARLRLDYLESHEHPLATFEVDEVSGLDGKLVEGKAQDLELTGDLTVKGITKPAAFTGTASLDDGALTAKVATKAKLSDFDAGPINIAGMVSTSDEATLTLKLTAYDPDERTIPTTITGPDAKEPKGGPSFARTVQPILEANCVSCHNTGQMGAHTLTLDNAGDAQAVSDGLKTVTELKHMPPWPASDKGVELEHPMKLSQKEIDAIATWSDAGAPLDVDAAASLRPTANPVGPAPRKDLVLERPAYEGSIENTNDYRCFVLDPKLTEPTYMTGYTFLEDQREELHHAQVFHVTEAQKANAAKVDGKDGQPGWSCYSGPGLSSFKLPAELEGKSRSEIRAWFEAHPDEREKLRGGDDRTDFGPVAPGSFSGQDGLVAGWVPGQSPVIFPEDSGILLQPGDALVLQLHYHFSDTPTPDRVDPRPAARPDGDQAQGDAGHQPDRAGRDPVRTGGPGRAAVRPRRRAGGQRPPLRPLGCCERVGLADALRPDRREAGQATFDGTARRRAATTSSPTTAPSSACSATCTRSARRSASPSTRTRRRRRSSSTSRSGASTGR